MPPADRDAIAVLARTLATGALAGNATAVKDASTPELQKDFSGVAAAVEGLRQDAGGAVTVSEIYLLDNTQARPGEESNQIFCSFNSTQHVTFSLPGLRAQRYAVVFARVTGVADPRNVSLIFENGNGWKLAGLVQKPLEQAGHDGLWYWQHARELLKQQQPWNAELSFLMAQQLLAPAAFVSSSNLEKLIAEARTAEPREWPSPDKPLFVTVEGRQLGIQEIAPFVAAHNFPDLLLAFSYAQLAGPEGCPSNETAKALAGRLPELAQFAPQATANCKGPQQDSILLVPLRGAR